MTDIRTTTTMNLTPPKSGKRRIIKNLVVMSFSFMLVFTAYDGLSMLQSTMNKEIGTVSQAVVYASFCLSSLLLPKYVIKKLGCKATFLVAATFYIPYIASNFYPSWLTLMPSSLILGIGLSLIWTALMTYLNMSAALYCTYCCSSEVQSVSISSGYEGMSIGNSKCTTSIEASSKNGCLPQSDVWNNTNVELIRRGTSEKEIITDYAGDRPLFSNESKNINVEDLSMDISQSNCNDLLKEKNGNRAIVEETLVNVSNFADTNLPYSNKKSPAAYRTTFKNTKNQHCAKSNNISVRNQISVNSALQSLGQLGKLNSSNPDVISSKANFRTYNDEQEHCFNDAIVLSVKYKFKGEITSEIRDVRDKYTNKNKFIVSGNSKVINNLEKPPNPTTNLEKRNTILNKISNIESITARFFGFNGLSFHSAKVWSNLISYYVLQNKNFLNSADISACTCGAEMCSIEPICFEETLEEADTAMRYLHTGISVLLVFVALFLVSFFLDPQVKDKEPTEFSLHNLKATFHHCKKRIQFCLVLISMYVGMIQGFYTADFTKSYIACALGKSNVGLVTIFYGLSCALLSTLSGWLVKYTGRIPILVAVQAVNVAAMVTLLVWTPDPSHPSVFYAAAGSMGMVVGILWSQIPAFYGILFKNNGEAAFASFYMFNSLGWTVSFLYSDYLCITVKLYILLVTSTFGIGGYLLSERMYRVRKSQSNFTYG